MRHPGKPPNIPAPKNWATLAEHLAAADTAERSGDGKLADGEHRKAAALFKKAISHLRETTPEGGASSGSAKPALMTRF